MKKQFAILLVFVSILGFGLANVPFVTAAGNELNTAVNLQETAFLPYTPEIPTINVLPSTTYTYTLSVTNSILQGNDPLKKVSIVLLKPRLPNTFPVGGPIACPSGWPAGYLGGQVDGPGSVVCVHPGYNTSPPYEITGSMSSSQYNIEYGQTRNISFTFTTPSSGITDLVLFVAYINGSGNPGGIGWTIHVVVVPPTCTSWTYSNWSSCSSNGNQLRENISSSPASCIIDLVNGPAPITRQNCTYIPPTPLCTSADWSCGNWNTCSANGAQARTCSKTSNCQGGISSPAITQSCSYTPPVIYTPPVAPILAPPVQPQQPSCTSDTWSCDNWNSCSLSGIQSRSCRKTFDCPNTQTPSPTVDQYCQAPSRQTQQVPQDFNQIINQDTSIKATVKLLCRLGKEWIGGSGTVIDPSGTILTNKHVIEGVSGCLVGFVNDFNDEPYFGDRQIADISKTSPSEDIAILKLRNPQNKTLPYIDIANGNNNSLRLGKKINIYGYPTIGGSKMTYTHGSFGGTDGSYLKTGAIIERGNSGGGAYLDDGTFIGIPSKVKRGELNALGYILSINVINGWLGNSSVAYSNNSNNNFSRVSSILETIDLKTLGSLQLVILNEKGTSNTAPAAVPSVSTPTQ